MTIVNIEHTYNNRDLPRLLGRRQLSSHKIAAWIGRGLYSWRRVPDRSVGRP